MTAPTTRRRTVDERRSDPFVTVIHYFDGQEPAVWTAAFLFFVGGDLLTTFVGLQFSAIEEMGPIAAILLTAFGFEALLLLKFLAIGVFVVFWWCVPSPSNVGVPFGVAIVGLFVTVWNTFIIGLVLLGG